MDSVAEYQAWLIADLKARRAADLRPFIGALEEIDLGAERRARQPELKHPAVRHLERVRADLAGGPPLDAARELDWLQVFDGGAIDPRLADGMLAAQLAGSYGRIPSDHVATGLFLLCPGVVYPLHTHAADEIYLCLSGQVRIQHGIDGAPFELSRGEYSRTPPNRLHGLNVGLAPVLLAYVWIGALAAPNWWWSQDTSGAWVRTLWRRAPGESWKPERSEPVREIVMKQAHS